LSTLNWCALCGTEHSVEVGCSAEAQVSGPEREVWRAAVETPRGIQGHAVLVSAVGKGWRARILTFPNVMWTVPGGGSSIKFLGHTPEEAERQAVSFVRRHCGVRGHVMRDELEPVTVALARGGGASARGSVAGSPRFERELRVRYGLNRPTIVGQTANISESGLFVVTRKPLPEGAFTGLLLEMEHCKVPLRGSVVWNRCVPGFGRDAGMGLSLLKPPTIYLRYVEALNA
jgi:hypothetical protein